MADLPIAVRIAGSVHGLLFVCLVVMLLMATTKVPIQNPWRLSGMLAAVVPFGPFVFDLLAGAECRLTGIAAQRCHSRSLVEIAASINDR